VDVFHAVSTPSLVGCYAIANIHTISGMLGLTVYGAAIFLCPQDEPVDPNGKIDWVGAYLGVGGLILFNFVWK
jgi:hypothetical protein